MHSFILNSALLFTAIYIVMAIMSMIGAEAHSIDGDFDVDSHGVDTHDGDNHSDFQILNAKNVLGLLVGLSWGTLIGTDTFKWEFIPSYLLGIFIGVLIVALQTSLFGFMLKLEQKGIVSLDSAVGKFGTVYLVINAGKTGKVRVDVNGSIKILYATSKQNIPTGTPVKITGIDNGILVVEISK